MGRKNKETTAEERKIIIRLHNQCKSLRTISKIVNRAHSTIQSIIDRYCYTGRLYNKPRKGRPTKLSRRSVNALLKKIKANPKLSAPKLNAAIRKSTDVSVCDSTIRNILRKNGYHGRTARRKYWINKVNQLKRLQFAKTYQNAPPEFWNKVIFTDESKFNIFKSDGKCLVWRKKNSELDKKNICASVKGGGGSVLVWGCMSAVGVGTLHFIDGIMDHRMYIDILKTNLPLSVAKMGLNGDYIFMQDNDPKHKAWNTRMWLLYNTPKQLETPPQSPDINPIEHIWDYLDKQIRTRHISNKTELKCALQEEWNNIPIDLTTKLVNSMQRRLSAIIDAKGFPTKY